MMNSSVPLYQCWPKKVSDFVAAHFHSHRSDVIPFILCLLFNCKLAVFINIDFMPVCSLQACWPVLWSKTFQFAVGKE